MRVKVDTEGLPKLTLRQRQEVAEISSSAADKAFKHAASKECADLIEAIRKQTAAINRMADSNAALVAAMADSEGMDDEDRQSDSYLDGSPCQ